MTSNELKRILRAFVNDPAELDVRQGRVVAQIHDELIDVALRTDTKTGELSINDGDTNYAPRAWLLKRIARLDLLADRILAYTPPTAAFVPPSGALRGDLSTSGDDADLPISDVNAQLEHWIRTPLPATTSILYLTSDAGEGKTTLISEVARKQAERCKARASSSLLLPIPLGGKTFLRFDDVVIGTLSNRYRFNRYFFDGFLELVRLGAVVPAFDGFEEMFVEGHSGEAVSALGSLIDALDSSGSIIVAARKAFFEYTSFRTQARLFDSIGDRCASFSRLRIDRWGKPQFLQYGRLRKYSDPEGLYERFSTRLSAEHPMLSRAFLVKRLFDLADESGTLDQLVGALGTTPQDYFFKFVETLVDREARLKWLDKSGDASHPLLTLEEHHELLAAIAREMWQSSVNALRLDVVDVIVDLFVESKRRGPTFARQVRERIKNHSLLANDPARGNLLEFDHDEFRRFYLGEALGRALVEKQQADLLSLVSADKLPADTCDQALNRLARAEQSWDDRVILVLDVARSASPLSFARENCGALLIRLLGGTSGDAAGHVVQGIVFPYDALAGRTLKDVRFRNCHLEATSIGGSSFSHVEFDDCDFERIELNEEDRFQGIILSMCRVNEVRLLDADAPRSLYGPKEINKTLLERGGIVIDQSVLAADSAEEEDGRVELVEKFLRVFLRATQVNEDTIRAKFGKLGSVFMDEVLPALVRAKVVQSVEYRGRGVQERYKLAVPMQDVQRALHESHGSFDRFLDTFK